MTRATGGCACRRIRYEIVGPLRDVVNCHCDRCRRATGHFMAATAAARRDVTIDDDATLQWWTAAAGIRYGFCGACGSTLFWEADDRPGHLSIAAGTIDPPSHLRTRTAIFTADAADYHRLDTTLENHPHDHGDQFP